MRVQSSKLYKYILNFLFIQIIFLCILQGDTYTQIEYESEIQLDYGIPIQLSEVSAPSSNIFVGYGIMGFSLKANFSNNNGSIWINDQNEYTIWEASLNEIIDLYINVNDSSIDYYTLWANSSTLGIHTLYYTFRPNIFQAGNVGLIIALISLPIMITIIIVIAIVRKGESRTIKIAKRITERMRLKYEAKHPEKVPKKERLTCPNCGAMAQDVGDNYCRECGYKFNE